MESTNPARSSSYSKLNDWNQSKNPPLIARRSKLSRWKRIFVVLVIISCIVFIGLGIGFGLSKIHEKCIPFGDKPFVQTYSQAVVSTQSPNCSIVGKNILSDGGSAVDAAIAVLICEGAYSPQSTGLGGGFFMLVYSKATGTVEAIDAREASPAKATSDLFQKDNSTLFGALAVAVPGELRGYELAHKKYGVLNWSQIFHPTIRLCREGITVSPRLSVSINEIYKDKLLMSPSLMPLFIRNDTGEFVQEGDVIHCPELADTLEIIAEKGADELYNGELGNKMLKDLEDLGGIMTVEDLKNYKAVVRDSVIFKLSDGIEVHSMPPPGGGLVLGLLLQVLDKIALNVTYDIDDFDDFMWAHYFVEACKYAFAKRAEIGDPDFENMAELIQSMTSPHLAERIKDGIQLDETFGPKHYESMFIPKYDEGTAHVSVLAPNGDAVAATGTINTGFGAIIRSTSTGIIFNNEMDDFSLPSHTNFYGLAPSSVNFIRPGKRPASSMAPTIILDGDRELTYVLGGSGGSRIISAEAYVYMMHEYRKYNLEDSITSKRLHHQLLPNEVLYEEGFDTEILESLKAKGHDLKEINNNFRSAVYLIYRNAVEKKIYGAADPRRNSTTDGY